MPVHPLLAAEMGPFKAKDDDGVIPEFSLAVERVW